MCSPTGSVEWGIGFWKPGGFGNSERKKVDASGRCYFVRGSPGAGKAYPIQERFAFGNGKERGGHRQVENAGISSP